MLGAALLTIVGTTRTWYLAILLFSIWAILTWLAVRLFDYGTRKAAARLCEIRDDYQRFRWITIVGLGDRTRDAE